MPFSAYHSIIEDRMAILDQKADLRYSHSEWNDGNG